MSLHNRTNNNVIIEVYNFNGDKINEFSIEKEEIKPLFYSESIITLSYKNFYATIPLGVNISLVPEGFLDSINDPIVNEFLTIKPKKNNLFFILIILLLLFLLIIVLFFKKLL